MTVRWGSLDADQKRLAEALFDARVTVDSLGSHREDDRERVVGIQALFDFATRPERADDQAVIEALAREPRLRRDLDRILARTALYRFPRAAAASSGSVVRRDGEGYRLELRASKAAADQTYVSIALAPTGGPAPRTLLVQAPGEAPVKRDLGPALNGAIQILVETESALVRALKDPKSEVYLR